MEDLFNIKKKVWVVLKELKYAGVISFGVSKIDFADREGKCSCLKKNE